MITQFDTKSHHIYIEFAIEVGQHRMDSLRGILDTGASHTELSDHFLHLIGIAVPSSIKLKQNQQTQKYSKLTITSLDLCGHKLHNFPTYISRFEETWGIDALIGLDFFRLFDVRINYKLGQIITEPLFT